MKIRLDLFGQPALRYGEQTISLSRSATLVLAYLGLYATRGRVVPRSRLAAVLAPDVDDEQARRTVSRSLYQLRRAVQSEFGNADAWLRAGTNVALSDLEVDVDLFSDLASSVEPMDWARALDLYQGDLMEDFDQPWLDAPRALLREHYRLTVERLVDALEPEQPELALPYALRLVTDDPLSEPAHLSLMRLQARLGRYGAALQQYEQLKQLLDVERGMPPLPETRALAEAIRAEYQTRALAPERVPLVGRAHELARLLMILERAQNGQGGCAIVLGEAGIGKSRLVEEVAQAAGWRGWQVAWGVAEEYTIPAPFAPLTQALRAALPEPRRQQIAQRGVSAYWLAHLDRIIADQANTDGQDAVVLADDAAQFPDAIAHILAGIQHIAPLLLILDDVQAMANSWMISSRA